MIAKDYNKLTPEQEKVIIHKATEAPFTSMKTEYLFAEGVTHHYFHHEASLMLVVDDQALMKASHLH